MPRQLYDTQTLLEVMREQEAPSNYWLDLLFGSTLTFDSEYVEFEKIPSQGRKLAPFVAPLAQGRPIFSEGSNVSRFKPAYTKPKDPVTPTRVMKRRPGEILAASPQSPAQRRNAIIADILLCHRDAIERREEWMAAQAVLYGSITVAGEDYPTQLLDFGREAGHSITLGAGARWGEAGVDILENVQTWTDLMHSAQFGGAASRITLGTQAWAKMRKDDKVMKEMDLTRRGNSELTIKTGLLETGEVRHVGSLGGGIEVVVYSDYYTVAGVATPFMDPRDVVLTAPSAGGHRCYGAIQDPHAEYQSLPIYSRNFMSDDPAAEFVMSQSAPLPVLVNPNATLRARVVA